MQSQRYDTYGTLTGMEGISHVMSNADAFDRRRHVPLILKRTANKLDTGLKFANSESTPDFLSKGETNASFQQSGNSPDVREQLIMRVMTGSRTSRQETTSDVGARSSGQDFFADCRTSFRTSSSLRGWKASSAFSGSISGSSGKTLFERELTALSISERME